MLDQEIDWTNIPGPDGHVRPDGDNRWNDLVSRLISLADKGEWSHAVVMHATQRDLQLTHVIGADPVVVEVMFDAFATSAGIVADPLLTVLRDQVTVIVNDAETDERIQDDNRPAYAGLGISSFLAVPLGQTPAALVLGRNGSIGESDLVNVLSQVSSISGSVLRAFAPHDSPYSWDSGTREREWVSLMLDSVSDPIIVSDQQNRILHLNRRGADLLSDKSEGSGGRRRAIELNNFLLSAALSSLNLGQNDDLAREFTLVDPLHGSEFLFEIISGSDTRSATGDIQVYVLRDVTDTHNAITELQRNLSTLEEAHESLGRERDQFAVFLEHAADPAIAADPRGEIVAASRSALHYLPAEGDKPRTPMAQNAYFTNKTSISSLLLKATLDPDTTHREMVTLVDPETGEAMAFQATTAAVSGNLGEPSAILCLLHDMTVTRELARQRVREQLFESEKMAAMGRLGAAMAHEINNPLEAIQNSLYLLDMKFPKNSPDRKYLEIAYSEIQRVSRIIRQMLGLYRPEAERSRVSLNSIVDEASDLLARHLRGKRIDIKKTLSRKLLPVLASADQIRQVLLNLMLNAADAIEDSGSIELITSNVVSSEDEDGGKKWVTIEIRDTGCGISPEIKDKIFDPFFSTKSADKGTGIGLWVTQDIVQQHEGQIEVESELGHGTKFTIRLPAAIEEA